MEKQITRENEQCSIDMLKLFLAILVVLRHCGQIFFESNSRFYYIVTNTISPIAVPTFFIISGFLFYSKPINRQRLKHQIFRILRLYLVWSILYLPLRFEVYQRETTKVSVQVIIEYVWSAIFDGTYYHLWYLPSLIVALTISYWITKYIRRKQQIFIVVLCYILGLLIDTYTFCLPQIQVYFNIYRNIFLTARNGIFFGLIFVCIGRYFSDNKEEIEGKIEKRLVLGLLSVIILSFVESYYLCVIHSKSVINMSVSSAFVAVYVFLIALKLNKCKKICGMPTVRNMSTIVFCLHPWILEMINRLYGQYNVVYKTVLTLFITLSISFICVKMSKRIKLIKYIM